MNFKSEEELYQRILPALKAREAEFNRNGYYYVKVEDIWNYLKETKWKVSRNLSISSMVSDILSLDYEDVDVYVKSFLKEQKRDVILESM